MPDNKTKSRKQVGLLLSKNSPLTKGQQEKLRAELHGGEVKVKGGPDRSKSKTGKWKGD